MFYLKSLISLINYLNSLIFAFTLIIFSYIKFSLVTQYEREESVSVRRLEIKTENINDYSEDNRQELFTLPGNRNAASSSQQNNPYSPSKLKQISMSNNHVI